VKDYATLSRLQFPMLRDFVRLGPDTYVSVSEASRYDQRPLGSLYHRGWIGYRAGRGFYATRAGREAYAVFEGDVARRKDELRPLSHYFEDVIASRTKAKQGAA